MNGLVGIHQLYFMPWPGFFNKMVLSEVFVINKGFQLQWEGYERRVRIKDSKWLTVPVIKNTAFLQPLSEALIKFDNFDVVWNKIYENYHKCPYFDDIKEIKKILENAKRQKIPLAELNFEILHFFISILEIRTHIIVIDFWGKNDPNKYLSELTDIYGCSYLSGEQAAKTYLNPSEFRKPVFVQKYYGDYPLSILHYFVTEGKEFCKKIIKLGDSIPVEEYSSNAFIV